jgi:hypothetical protein
MQLPDGYHGLYNLGYSPESITDALYKTADVKTNDAAIKNKQS